MIFVQHARTHTEAAGREVLEFQRNELLLLEDREDEALATLLALRTRGGKGDRGPVLTPAVRGQETANPVTSRKRGMDGPVEGTGFVGLIGCASPCP